MVAIARGHIGVPRLLMVDAPFLGLVAGLPTSASSFR